MGRLLSRVQTDEPHGSLHLVPNRLPNGQVGKLEEPIPFGAIVERHMLEDILVDTNWGTLKEIAHILTRRTGRYIVLYTIESDLITFERELQCITRASADSRTPQSSSNCLRYEGLLVWLSCDFSVCVPFGCRSRIDYIGRVLVPISQPASLSICQ